MTDIYPSDKMSATLLGALFAPLDILCDLSVCIGCDLLDYRFVFCHQSAEELLTCSDVFISWVPLAGKKRKFLLLSLIILVA